MPHNSDNFLEYREHLHNDSPAPPFAEVEDEWYLQTANSMESHEHLLAKGAEFHPANRNEE
jgi:hypothetical protein